MRSTVFVISTSSWIVFIAIMATTINATNLISKNSRFSHRMSSVGGVDRTIKSLPFDNTQFPIRHRKYRKLDQVIKDRLDFSSSPLSKYFPFDNRNGTATSATTQSSNNERDTLKKSFFQRSDHSHGGGANVLIPTLETNKESGPSRDASVELSSSLKTKIEEFVTPIKKKLLVDNTSKMMSKVSKHVDKMKRDTLCSIPSPVVVQVEDEYPDTDRERITSYHPKCIKLHRCSNQSGCCHKQTLQCSANKTENVELPFKIIVKEKNTTLDVRYQLLTFKNHTKCSCQINVSNEKMQQDANSPSTASSSWMYDSSVESSNNISWDDECNCPHPFAKRELPDNTCICDCFDKDTSCLRQKRGEEPLAPDQTYCVSSGKCSLPSCEYGMYWFTRGTCPKYYGQ